MVSKMRPGEKRRILVFLQILKRQKDDFKPTFFGILLKNHGAEILQFFCFQKKKILKMFLQEP